MQTKVHPAKFLIQHRIIIVRWLIILGAIAYVVFFSLKMKDPNAVLEYKYKNNIARSTIL